jgi:hypothetical protein
MTRIDVMVKIREAFVGMVLILTASIAAAGPVGQERSRAWRVIQNAPALRPGWRKRLAMPTTIFASPKMPMKTISAAARIA